MARPLLVLLPGLVCDAAAWQAQRVALAGTADTVVADYGAADSLGAIADGVLAAVARPRFALAGHSMGGHVALEMLRRAPQRIERLEQPEAVSAQLARWLGA